MSILYSKLENGRILAIPQRLASDIDVFLFDITKSNMDGVFVLDGKEGTGKSRSSRVLGCYVALRLGVTFGVDNIHFTVDDYIVSAENGSKYQINILDESREALNIKSTMSKSNKRFTNWLSENRDKQQIHILNLPAVQDLDPYISKYRMSLLLNHVKKHDSKNNLMKGLIKVYPNDNILKAYLSNKVKYGAYTLPKKYAYWCQMPNYEPFTNEQLNDYNEKKAIKRKEKYMKEEK